MNLLSAQSYNKKAPIKHNAFPEGSHSTGNKCLSHNAIYPHPDKCLACLRNMKEETILNGVELDGEGKEFGGSTGVGGS